MLDDRSAPRALTLPPPYTAHWLAQGSALHHACALADAHGAGTLVWHSTAQKDAPGRFDFAVVLEPETPLAEARRAFILGMLALGDAISAHCPPERAVGFGWPGELRLDGGRLGGMRLHTPPDITDAEVPDWMVLGVELIADRDHLSAPGSKPNSVSLKEEDFADPPAILESFAAYLMLYFDRLNHGGFDPLAASYVQRLNTDAKLNSDGDLQTGDGLLALKDALATSHWRDETGPIL